MTLVENTDYIDKTMTSAEGKWLHSKIADLPERARYAAYSSIRSLNWSSHINKELTKIPSQYMSLHATEEAVVCLVETAKYHGINLAKKINTRVHIDKSIISILAQNTINIFDKFNPAISIHKELDILCMRITINGKQIHNEASLKFFNFNDEKNNNTLFDEILNLYKNLEDLKKYINESQEARNNIMYSSKTGLPTGFENHESCLRRETNLSLALIWASIDLTKYTGENIFVSQFFETAVEILNTFEAKPSAAQS